MLHRPEHRIDAIPVYVSEWDTAWDQTAIESSLAEMRAAGQDTTRHPVAVYHSGESRYDLGARYAVGDGQASAADYLDVGQAWSFSLRRLTYQQYLGLLDTLSRAPATTQAQACRLGLVSVTGRDAPPISAPLSERDMESLFSLGVVLEIGQAVILCSKPLGHAEKKH